MPVLPVPEHASATNMGALSLLLLEESENEKRKEASAGKSRAWIHKLSYGENDPNLSLSILLLEAHLDVISNNKLAMQ